MELQVMEHQALGGQDIVEERVGEPEEAEDPPPKYALDQKELGRT